MMAHNQIHEQLNAIVKGDGGIIGITENESAMRCWMIAGSDMTRIVSEVSIKQCGTPKCSYHEQIPSAQNRFARNVKNVVDIFNDMGILLQKQAQIYLLLLTRKYSWLMKLFKVLGKLKI